MEPCLHSPIRLHDRDSFTFNCINVVADYEVVLYTRLNSRIDDTTTN